MRQGYALSVIMVGIRIMLNPGLLTGPTPQPRSKTVLPKLCMCSLLLIENPRQPGINLGLPKDRQNNIGKGKTMTMDGMFINVIATLLALAAIIMCGIVLMRKK